ncbi:MAG: DNA polymerase III subunit chi [Hyphomonadaceae bacterium]
MSGELWFYHLERSGVEATLASLVERCLSCGWRALIRGGLPERLEAIDAALWTYRDEAFLPHGMEGRDDPERQPVFLTPAAGNPNRAAALFAIDGAGTEDAAQFERAIVLFDGRDEAALSAARARWKAARGEGLAVSYWKESAQGRWEKQS